MVLVEMTTSYRYEAKEFAVRLFAGDASSTRLRKVDTR